MTAELRQLVEGTLMVLAALIPIVNPLGNAPLFLAMTADQDDAVRESLARKVALYGFVLLLASVFIGNFVLKFFGVSVPVVQIAGGLVVGSLAWRLLGEGASVGKPTGDPGVDSDAITARAFYPLTLPLTVGPGSISVAITIGANFPSTVQPFIADAVSAVIGVTLVCVVTYLCYRYSDRLAAFLGRNGTAVVLRLSAFILLCIGVQIAWNGVDALLGVTHVRPQ